MDIKDIKIGCIVQVFDYCKQGLEMYKVLNVYVSKDNEIVFKCNKMKFNEKKELVITLVTTNVTRRSSDLTNVIRFIDGKDVMSIYNKINHE